MHALHACMHSYAMHSILPMHLFPNPKHTVCTTLPTVRKVPYLRYVPTVPSVRNVCLHAKYLLCLLSKRSLLCKRAPLLQSKSLSGILTVAAVASALHAAAFNLLQPYILLQLLKLAKASFSCSTSLYLHTVRTYGPYLS